MVAKAYILLVAAVAGALVDRQTAPAIVQGAEDAPVRPTNPLVVIYAARLEDVEAKVKQAGGKIVRQTYPFPGGRRFHFSDPSGNELAVWTER